MIRTSLKVWCLAATLVVAPCAMAAPSVQVGFSPEGSAMQLVLRDMPGVAQTYLARWDIGKEWRSSY